MPKVSCFKLPSGPVTCSASCLSFVKPDSSGRGDEGMDEYDGDEYARSRAIDKELAKAKRSLKREVKLLLLGAGESGKSTFVKQMRIIHGHTFDPELVHEYRHVIYNNIIRGMKVLVDARDKLSIQWQDPGNQIYADHIFTLDNNVCLEPVEFGLYAASVYALWQDRGIRRAFDRRNEFCISDGVSFLMDNLSRISRRDYVPSDQDILHARKATKAITEFATSIQGIPFRFVDVGGQRSQRQKWFKCFDSVTSILFFVASSEYDQVLVEDKATNRLLESLNIFDTIINNVIFAEVSMILFMNKSDILQTKILKSRPLSPGSSSAPTDLSSSRKGSQKRRPRPPPNCRTSAPPLLSPPVSLAVDEDSASLTSVSTRDSLTDTDSSDEDSSSSSSHSSRRTKGKSLPFDRYFPSFCGDPFDVRQVQDFLIRMFDSVRRTKSKRLFSHCTTAVDTQNIKLVFSDVRMTILQKNITALMLQ